MKQLFALSALLALIVTAVLATPAQAAPNERCFTETGFCISGTILSYWEKNGGLPVFGYPITPQRTETIEGTWTGPVQWFERDRLEDHINEGKGILAGRLGARWLELQGRPWVQGTGPVRGDGNCTHFPQTGYNICDTFSTFWRQNGTEIRLGYPITEVINETIAGKTY